MLTGRSGQWRTGPSPARPACRRSIRSIASSSGVASFASTIRSTAPALAHDQPAVERRVGRLEAQHRQVGAAGAQVEQRRDVLGRSAAGSRRRSPPRRRRSPPAPRAPPARRGRCPAAGPGWPRRRRPAARAACSATGERLGAGHDHDPLAAGALRRRRWRGPACARPPTLCSTLGSRRLHPRALAGGQDDRGAMGHGASSDSAVALAPDLAETAGDCMTAARGLGSGHALDPLPPAPPPS